MRKLALAASLAAFAALPIQDALAQAAFPPPPPKVSPAAGVIDMHVHSHPDVFGRNMDDIDVARSPRRAACAASCSRTTSARPRAAPRW